MNIESPEDSAAMDTLEFLILRPKTCDGGQCHWRRQETPDQVSYSNDHKFTPVKSNQQKLRGTTEMLDLGVIVRTDLLTRPSSLHPTSQVSFQHKNQLTPRIWRGVHGRTISSPSNFPLALFLVSDYYVPYPLLYLLIWSFLTCIFVSQNICLLFILEILVRKPTCLLSM